MHHHRSRWSASVVALMAACVVALPRPSHAGRIDPPNVPGDLVVSPLDYRPYFVGHALGTQNYVCLPTATGFAWTFYGPQATLFDDHGTQATTHYLSPNPQESGLPRPAWQHSRDTSTVWAKVEATSSDPTWVAPGAIPWLKLVVVGQQRGVDGGRRLTDTVYIQRINTVGGVAPATGCSESAHVGAKALVPYETDYVFYKSRRREK